MKDSSIDCLDKAVGCTWSHTLVTVWGHLLRWRGTRLSGLLDKAWYVCTLKVLCSSSGSQMFTDHSAN